MPTDTKPFYRHILGTHWKDKPNKGLDVEVKKKKKKGQQFSSKAKQPATSAQLYAWILAPAAPKLPRQVQRPTWEQLCGGSFTVHGCSRQRLQSTYRCCIAICGTPNTTDRCQERNQQPGISVPISMRGKKYPERFKHPCLHTAQWFDMHGHFAKGYSSDPYVQTSKKTALAWLHTCA